jgi:Flp pilus assembly protein protease CpaA
MYTQQENIDYKSSSTFFVLAFLFAVVFLGGVVVVVICQINVTDLMSIQLCKWSQRSLCQKQALL